MEAYCIDLDAARPEIMIFSGAELQADLDFVGTRDPEDLSDYDRVVFRNETRAERFFARYMKILGDLRNDRICLSRDLPCMLYKRRYIVQTLMGLKNFTEREYCKPWRPGDMFNLHDQTYFLTVRLLGIDKKKDEEGVAYYRYNFELP